MKIITLFRVSANCTCALLCALILSGSYISAAAFAQGFQANLNSTERTIATDLALGSAKSSMATNTYSSRQSNSALAAIQVLMVEVKEQKQRDPSRRLAEIFLYNYATESAQYTVVDLTQFQVVKSESVATQHLPLNTIEREYARQRVSDDNNIMQLILAELQQYPYSMLDSKVAIYEPLPTQGTLPSPCAVRRCAQLTFTTTERLSLTVEPIVILATGEVMLPGVSSE